MWTIVKEIMPLITVKYSCTRGKNMKRILLCSVALIVASLDCAFAAHSSYSPMAPRQLSVKSSKADYTYGLSVLPGNSIDSVEVFNRNLPWKTNYYVLDKYLLRPTAVGYSKLPDFTKTGVHNFLSNIGDINNTVNNLFLGRVGDSSSSLGRFTINSTVGILGLFDVASLIGLEYKEMAFDTVLGKAGMDNGAYVMVPVIGPVTERRIHAKAVDNWQFTLVPSIYSVAYGVLSAVEARAGLLSQEDMVFKSVDPYAQTRQMFLQYSQGKVNPNEAMENKADENVDEFMDEID